MNVRLPDGTIINNVPDNITKADLVTKLKANGYDTSSLEAQQQPQEPGAISQTLKGAATGAADIGNTLINAATFVPRTIERGVSAITGQGTPLNEMNAQRQASLANYAQENDQSGYFTAGRIGSNIAGTLGAGPALGKTLLALSSSPRAAALAQSIIDSGTTGTIGNKILGGAAAGAVGAAMIDPDSTAAGAALGAVSGPALAAASGAVDVAKGFRRVKPTSPEVQSIVQQANLGAMQPEILESIKRDVATALSTSGDVSPDAMRRLADYRAVGATPMRSSLTLNPADVTREQNLVKLSANSRDPAAQRLANIRNENNARLIQQLNAAGASAADDPMAASGRLISALSEQDTASRSGINTLYEAARGTEGRSASLDPSVFTNRANDLLDEALLGGKLPSDVRNLLNHAATGKMPLNVDMAEQFKTRIGELQRASRDPAERLALGKVRQALEEAPLIEGQGQGAIDAFNRARKANAAYMQVVDNTPALKAVRDGVEPDRFINQYVIGPSVTVKDMENLRKVLKNNPQALETVKEQVIADLKNKATGGAADEVAKISQSAYNKRLKDIGDAKLGVFFNKDEIANLKRIGRVSSYEQFQPAGSAVNNSNTAAAGFTALLDRIGESSLLRQIPLGGELIANPAKSVSTAIQARNALNTGKGIARELPKTQRPVNLNAGPFAAYLYQND